MGCSSVNIPLDYELEPSHPGHGLQDADRDNREPIREFVLPPVDRGRGAWLCLVGAFVLEMAVWGESGISSCKFRPY